jgi:RNA polymerase sigma factor (sigma-70 family)
MTTKSDHALLAAYAEQRDDDAFAEVVRRHAGAVHAAAWRQTGHAHLADEVLQIVFLRLAQKAGSLSSETVVIGWLIQATRYAALDIVRREVRLQKHQEKLKAMETVHSSPASEADPDPWEQVAPVLDQALSRMRESDRTALLLRFFSRQSLAEVAAALDIAEEAARKRVTRALERLREELAALGVTSVGLSLPDMLQRAAPDSTPGLVQVALHPQPGAERWVRRWNRRVWLRPLTNALSVVSISLGVICLVVGISEQNHMSKKGYPWDRSYVQAGFQDAHTVHRFLGTLQNAIQKNGQEVVINAVKYPLQVHRGGETLIIQDEVGFRREFDQLMTPAIRAAILQAPDHGLFCAPQGIMVGAGYVWLGPVEGTPEQPKIIALNIP